MAGCRDGIRPGSLPSLYGAADRSYTVIISFSFSANASSIAC